MCLDRRTTPSSIAGGDGSVLLLLRVMEDSSAAHHRLATRLLGNPEDAREVLQEAWLRAWRHRASLEDERAVGAWLRRIVIRESFRAMRRRDLRRWFGALVSLAEPPESLDPAPSPEERLGESHGRAAIARAVERLSSRQRLVWHLRFHEGWSLVEIAESAGLKPDTVRTHLNRALESIQRQVELDHAL